MYDLDEMRRLLEEGLKAARAGDVVDGEEFFDQLERELEELDKADKGDGAEGTSLSSPPLDDSK